VSSGDTRQLIQTAVERFFEEVPALKQLRLVIRLELPARGDVPVWRVEVPGPTIAKDAARDAKMDVSVPRANFNDLATKGTLKNWVDAYERGIVKVSGEPAVVKLIGSVIERRSARAR
jgi:hypothetical protein